MQDYQDFLNSKKLAPVISGFDVLESELNENLFDFQRAIVKWALKRGRAAIFADTGLGKTLMQTSWAEQVVNQTNGDVLIFAPLCVAQQTIREGEKFGISINYCREDDDVKHMCPLQLDVIERAMELWTAKDDLVFSPFTGIGSEGYVAVQMGRRFIGSELKPAYFKEAVNNLKDAKKQTMDLFSEI